MDSNYQLTLSYRNLLLGSQVPIYTFRHYFGTKASWISHSIVVAVEEFSTLKRVSTERIAVASVTITQNYCVSTAWLTVTLFYHFTYLR